MGAGIATADIEHYLPLFFDETATVFDYQGDEATVVLHGDLEPAFQLLAGHQGPLPPGAERATTRRRPRRCFSAPTSSTRSKGMPSWPCARA